MQTLPLYENGQSVGTLRCEREGLYIRFEARTDEARAGICRAHLLGERGETLLGVLEPERGGMVCRRRYAEQQLRGLGAYRCGELRSAQTQAWRPYAGELGGDWSASLSSLSGLLFAAVGEQKLLAAPWTDDKAFPLPELFCFASVRSIAGGEYAVFAFDASNRPAFSA